MKTFLRSQKISAPGGLPGDAAHNVRRVLQMSFRRSLSAVSPRCTSFCRRVLCWPRHNNQGFQKLQSCFHSTPTSLTTFSHCSARHTECLLLAFDLKVHASWVHFAAANQGQIRTRRQRRFVQKTAKSPLQSPCSRMDTRNDHLTVHLDKRSSEGKNNAASPTFHWHLFCASCFQPASRGTEFGRCFFLPNARSQQVSLSTR